MKSDSISTFTRADTHAVKGVAILLMLLHHLWSFPDRMPGGVNVISGPFANVMLKGDPWFVTFGYSCRICVALFVMLSGYGMYAQYAAGKLHLGRKISKLYIMYWKMLAVILPICYFIFPDPAAYDVEEDVLTGRYDDFDLSDLILSIFGVSASYNREWWCFICFVICFVIGAVYLRLTKRVHHILLDVIFCVIINLLINHLLPLVDGGDIQNTIIGKLWWGYYYNLLTPFLAGIICAKYGIFNRILSVTARLRLGLQVLLGITLIVVVFALRINLDVSWLDFAFAPLLALGVIIPVHALHRLGSVLGFFGRYSAYMWLTHSFYCYYWPAFVLLVYRSGNALMDLVILVALATGTAVGLTYLWREIDKGSGYILLKLKRK